MSGILRVHVADDIITLAPGRILVVDDDAELRALLAKALERHGFDVQAAANTTQAHALLDTQSFDVMVLDIMMPGEDGLSFCRKLTSGKAPMILMLSALDSLGDRIVGLEVGADAYLPKPCDPRELVATVRALLRRAAAPTVRDRDDQRIAEFDGWRLNLETRELAGGEQGVAELPAAEFLLLKALLERPRRLLSRSMLLDVVHSDDVEVYDRAIDVQISRLRRRFGAQGRVLIRTMRGEGYMFAAAVTIR